jgi:ketosteroid isomerase-like protein
MSKLVVSALLPSVAQPDFIQRLKLSAEQEEVWRLEEKYWQIVEARDCDGYIALWDEDFVGWPDNCAAPIRKDVIRSDTFGTLRRLKNFHLEPRAVQVFEEVAITFYLVTAAYTPTNGNDELVTFRCTHTWRKVNGVWLIFGGMSSPDRPQRNNELL